MVAQLSIDRASQPIVPKQSSKSQESVKEILSSKSELSRIAKTLVEIFGNDSTSKEVHNLALGGLVDLSNDLQIHLNHPKIVRIAFLLICEELRYVLDVEQFQHLNEKNYQFFLEIVRAVDLFNLEKHKS